MIVAKLAPKVPAFAEDAFSRQVVEEKLREWRELWLQHREGMTNCTLTLEDIWRQIDMWLDELLDLKGR